MNDIGQALGFTPEMLLGKPTLHLPINMIVQQAADPDDDGNIKVAGVYQTHIGNQLLYGSEKTHQLILADAFIRPRLVYDTNAFRGSGLSHLATSGFADIEKWQNEGELLFLRQ